MKHPKKQKFVALFAGAAAMLAFTPQSHAQSADALIDKLVDKGILTVKEAQDLRDEADKNFTTAFQTKTGMPDWVTGYKISGDVRGRMDWLSTENPGSLAGVGGPSGVDRLRWRYRIRLGLTVTMLDSVEAGFRLGSGDGAGNPVSNNTTMENNFSKKPLWVDTAYGKWTPINGNGWLLSATVGKMDNPFLFTPMVFDPDITPEGGALQAGYIINNVHSLSLVGAGFVLDEQTTSSHDPAMYGGQLIWNAKWSPKWSTSLGAGALNLVNRSFLTTANVPNGNQGNTRVAVINPANPALFAVGLVNHYNPVIADASVTYVMDSFPLYTGAFPVKLAGELMNNPGASRQNSGFWAGLTLGKSGTKHSWDLTYRYEYLEADAWYDQMVDDDNQVFYSNASFGGGTGFVSGTNFKGHLVKLNYSLTDALTLSFGCYINELIAPNLNVPGGLTNPKSSSIHAMADMLWKF